MNQLLKNLWDNAADFYETMRKSDVLTGNHYEGKGLKLFVDRRVLNDIWNQSKSDMKNGKETLGTLSGYLKKNRTNGDDCFEYYITSAKRLQSGLSEAEIDRKSGCLAPLIAGAVEIDKAFPFFENHIGVYHTHPLVTSIRYSSPDKLHKVDLPAEESSVDYASYNEITRIIRKAKGYDVSLLPFCVSTSYAEGKIVWDILFQQILPKYVSIEPVEIKRAVFEPKNDMNDGILNRHVSAHEMGDALQLFYEEITRGNYTRIAEVANGFIKKLADQGHTREPKLYGPDTNTIVQWINTPILWNVARENAVNNDVLASYEITMADASADKNWQNFGFPLYETKMDKLLGMKRHLTGVEYYGDIPLSTNAANFKRDYKKKFKKEFRGMADEIKESNGTGISLTSVPEVVEAFGYLNSRDSIMRFNRYFGRLRAQASE